MLQGTRSQPAFPRWTAYLSFWTALLLVPAGLIPFFKTGPFAWDGLFGCWVVAFGFASRMMVQHVCGLHHQSSRRCRR